ncbi:transposase [Streptomyces sp. NPDC002769]|uniref:transposase n=1 Tax=Streptomyces sp. NPDC002769 TaxID=3154542 RepID=UPI00331926F2
MTGRGDLAEAEWRCPKPFLPAANNRCGRWRDHRQVVDGILHRVRTGVQWRDLPERYGPWKTVYERHRRWAARRDLGAAAPAGAGPGRCRERDRLGRLGRFHLDSCPRARRRRPRAPPPAASKGAVAMAHQSGMPWARLRARLVGVVQEVRRSVAPEEGSPPRST